MKISKSVLALCLMALLPSCTKITEALSSKHKVTFDVELESTDGNRAFAIECFNYEDFDAYNRDQMAALLSGKKPTVKLPEAYKFKTEGKPENKLTAVIELPQDKLTCAVDGGKFIVVRLGEEASEVFIPKGDTAIKISYNMYVKKLYKSDSAGANVELVKLDK